MNIDEKIYVAGHRGLVGSAIVRTLQRAAYTNLVLPARAELDLANQEAVRRFFISERPAYVFLAAAKVGGIMANNTYPAEFISQNLRIQSNVVESSCETGVKRLLFLGSSCIYPKFATQPMREESLLSGVLEPTNRPYAVAKIAGIEMCWAYNRQHGTRYVAVMPTNLYGPEDNYDLDASHVIPALIRKMHEAKSRGQREVVLWGTGTPKREFLYSEDLADACLFLMNLNSEPFDSLATSERDAPVINVGCGRDQTIRELAELIANIVGFEGTLKFDPRKPDGTPRKLLDISRMSSLGWEPKTSLQEGLSAVYQRFRTGSQQRRYERAS
jgi:GDP-L-fucose synthase